MHSLGAMNHILYVFPLRRTHFYRQFRRDLIDGNMKCPTHSVSDVVACILQGTSEREREGGGEGGREREGERDRGEIVPSIIVRSKLKPSYMYVPILLHNMSAMDTTVSIALILPLYGDVLALKVDYIISSELVNSPMSANYQKGVGNHRVGQ